MKHTDGLDSIGATPGETVRCTGMRDATGYQYFQKGHTYQVVASPLGDPCIMTTINKTSAAKPMPMRGFGFFFEKVQA